MSGVTGRFDCFKFVWNRAENILINCIWVIARLRLDFTTFFETTEEKIIIPSIRGYVISWKHFLFASTRDKFTVGWTNRKFHSLTLFDCAKAIHTFFVDIFFFQAQHMSSFLISSVFSYFFSACDKSRIYTTIKFYMSRVFARKNVKIIRRQRRGIMACAVR